MTVSDPSSARSNATKYRADIDGLRAVAVLSVVLFHIWPGSLPGGFVGVDVFFVISGYLITTRIVEELGRDDFSLLNFYGRRAKRIAPAMLVVVAVTSITAKMIMLPDDATAVAKSAVSSVASLANVYFWRGLDASYFAAQDRDVPLLHLWSLGVEEQYYLLWPLLLILLARVRKTPAFVVAIALIASASFALGEMLFARDPSFVYYMLPTRAGELLVGALACNAVMGGLEITTSRARTAIGLVGFLLLAASLATLSEHSVFPEYTRFPRRSARRFSSSPDQPATT